MIKDEKIFAFLINVDHLSKGEKAVLARNHKLFKDAKYDVVLTIMKCIPDDVYVSESDYQLLLFIASVRCELGDNKTVSPRNAVVEVICKMQSGDNKFSDLLQQDTTSGRVYPLMRRYLSMYKGPINTFSLYKDLSFWDKDASSYENQTMGFMPVRYEWANAFAKQSRH